MWQRLASGQTQSAFVRTIEVVRDVVGKLRVSIFLFATLITRLTRFLLILTFKHCTERRTGFAPNAQRNTAGSPPNKQVRNSGVLLQFSRNSLWTTARGQLQVSISSARATVEGHKKCSARGKRLSPQEYVIGHVQGERRLSVRQCLHSGTTHEQQESKVAGHVLDSWRSFCFRFGKFLPVRS